MSIISDPTTNKRGEDKMYIGIDLHKETGYPTTLDKEGEIIDRREFKNEIGEIERFPDYKKLCSFAGLG
ncbi:MAG: hypothetical protein KAT65_03380 [Methanophagales archaeon]|nr:hypothetical protein [Methanophagales archaeon]